MSSMLHRSFKPAKCKTALKLAVSRIKLLKNKREAHVRQLKRELAQLLESGQDQTARIRVEHVIREEKTMAAYDLVEIYCELIAARLPMIESQKNCPIDLKEAISSVIFATPRCSDIPELIDVRKHITAKYGKEFVSAAIELRPDCGVNRLLVEKLSAKAPDGPTKIKILAAIAEEHNIKWEPKSFGENDVKSSQDLLVGPNTFEKAAYVEPSLAHVPPVRDEKGPPNLHASSQLKAMPDISTPTHDKSTPMHDISTGSYEQSASGATRNESGNQPTTSGMSNPKIMSPGTASQEMDYRDSYSENRGQNWNMEFKDAASAAQAAAESAERASIAARAAAELSNRENIARQHSSGSHGSSGSRLRDEVPQDYAFHVDKHLSTGSVNSTFHRSSSGMHNEQINAREGDNLVGAPDEYYGNSQESVTKHAQSASLTSVSAFDDNPFANGSEMADVYEHNSFEQGSSDFHEVSIKRQASTTEVDFVTKLHGDSDLNTEDYYHFGDARTNRQSRQASSSRLISPSDDHNDNLNLSGWKMGNKAVEDLFATDEENTRRNTTERSSYNDTSVVFDDSASEDDDYKFDFDKKYKGEFFSSPGSKSQVDSLENTNFWRHGQDINEKESSSSSQAQFSVVSEGLTKSAISSEKEDMLPVTFDDSDDSGSDSKVDLVKSKVSVNFDYANSVLDQSANHGPIGSSTRTDKNVGSDRKSWLSPSSVGSDTLEGHFERKGDIATVSEKNYGYNDLPTSQPSSKGRSSILDSDLKADIHASQSPDTSNDTETSQESHLESGKELNYGTLKGGLRNKGYRRPTYIKSTLNDVSSSSEDTLVQNERSLPTVRTSISSDTPAQDEYTREPSRGNRSVGLRARSTFSDSDNYDLATNSQESLTSAHEPRIQMEQSETKKKSSSRTSITFFDSDDSDSEDEHPKQNIASFAHPVSGISRRTSATSKTGPKDASLSKGSVTPGTKLGWKSSRASYESKNQEASSMKSSEKWASSETRSGEHAVAKPISEPNRSLRGEVAKSSASVQPSSSLPTKVIQDSDEGQEASKSLNSDADTPSKQTAGHVHPKLPDYDSFAAHFLSLKKGHQ